MTQQSTHMTISVLKETYDILQQLRKQMPDDKGFPGSTPVVISKIVDSYLQAHPEIEVKK